MAHANINERQYFVGRMVNTCDELIRYDICGVALAFECSETTVRLDIKYINNGGEVCHASQINTLQPEGLSANKRRRIKNEMGWKCSYCGITEDIMTVDHIIPISKGGGNEKINLTTSCKSCNCQKNDMMIEEWAEWLKLKKESKYKTVATFIKKHKNRARYFRNKAQQRSYGKTISNLINKEE